MWAESDGELLWLWYAVFTVALLGLIIASFVRFHYKRGQQQKLRLDAELSHAAKRRHVTPSSSFTNHVTPAAAVNLDTQRLLTSHANDVRGHAGHHHHGRSRGREDGDVRRAPVVYMFNANGSMVDLEGHSPETPQDQPRSSLVFGVNVNGSMVDVRCEQLEVCNTFRFDNDYNRDDQQHIHLHSSNLDLDLQHLKDVDKSCRPRSCLKGDPLSSRSEVPAMDGELPQSNHLTHSSQLHLVSQYQHYQHQQQQHRQRLSPIHHRYRHRHVTS